MEQFHRVVLVHGVAKSKISMLIREGRHQGRPSPVPALELEAPGGLREALFPAPLLPPSPTPGGLIVVFGGSPQCEAPCLIFKRK